MFEDALTAIQNFRTNKMRTLLSLLGIIIGVASVVITMNLAKSLEASIQEMFKDFSTSVITIRPSSWRNQALTFNAHYCDMLKKHIPEIKHTFLMTSINASPGRGKLDAGMKECFGIDYGYIEANKWELEYGQTFTLTDFMLGSPAAVIGEEIAKGLFPEGNAAGKKITLTIKNGSGSPPIVFTVMVRGVLKKKRTGFGRMERYILLPRMFMVRKLGMPDTGFSVDIELYDGIDAIESVEARISALSDDLAKSPHAVRIFSMKSEQQRNKSTLLMITLVLSGIAGLSLLIGGIGIMNIMLVTVAERRQEIGIRKAIGAPRGAILSQFLAESAIISIIGGCIGIAFGGVLSIALVKIALSAISGGELNVIFAFDKQGAIMAFLLSTAAGIFFGLYPAWWASRLDPVKALEE
ncbi:MAG: ABC transporter permease [Treponema sp.]